MSILLDPVDPSNLVGFPSTICMARGYDHYNISIGLRVCVRIRVCNYVDVRTDRFSLGLRGFIECQIIAQL